MNWYQPTPDWWLVRDTGGLLAVIRKTPEGYEVRVRLTDVYPFRTDDLEEAKRYAEVTAKLMGALTPDKE